jgi:SAM-dependent methyltransferase
MDQRSAWDRYWHADRIASCMDGAGQTNYDARIAPGWASFFAALPAGSRILDLCTGNGAIAAIAAETGRASGKNFAITGVDLADIDPLKFVSHYGDAVRAVHFVGNVACEALPFADASFDAVTSQYGIEYSDLGRSLGEAVRLLAPGGRLRFGMHAAEGTVVANTHRGIADADFLLDEVRLCDAAARCIEAVTAVERALVKDEGKRRGADQSFAEFKTALARTEEYLARATDKEMIQNSGAVLLHTFKNRGGAELPVLLAKVEEVRLEIDAHRQRQIALVEAAVSSARMKEIAGQLGELGMTDAACTDQRAGVELLGYVIEATQPH